MFRITEGPSSGSLVQCLAVTAACCHNTDYVHVNGHDRTIFLTFAKHCTRLPDDGSSVIRNMLEHFEIFYNFNCIYELYFGALVG